MIAWSIIVFVIAFLLGFLTHAYLMCGLANYQEPEYGADALVNAVKEEK